MGYATSSSSDYGHTASARRSVPSSITDPNKEFHNIPITRAAERGQTNQWMRYTYADGSSGLMTPSAKRAQDRLYKAAEQKNKIFERHLAGGTKDLTKYWDAYTKAADAATNYKWSKTPAPQNYSGAPQSFTPQGTESNLKGSYTGDSPSNYITASGDYDEDAYFKAMGWYDSPEPQSVTSVPSPIQPVPEPAQVTPVPEPKPLTNTLLASHDKPLFKSVPASGPRGDEMAPSLMKEHLLRKGVEPLWQTQPKLEKADASLPDGNIAMVQGTDTPSDKPEKLIPYTLGPGGGHGHYKKGDLEESMPGKWEMFDGSKWIKMSQKGGGQQVASSSDDAMWDSIIEQIPTTVEPKGYRDRQIAPRGTSGNKGFEGPGNMRPMSPGVRGAMRHIPKRINNTTIAQTQGVAPPSQTRSTPMRQRRSYSGDTAKILSSGGASSSGAPFGINV